MYVCTYALLHAVTGLLFSILCSRTFPMDMAGFAISITAFLAKPDVKMGFNTEKGRKHPVKDGHLETDYLENFASRSSVECRGSDKEVQF